MDFQVLKGDCRDVMKSLANCSVDAIVTDPPYELGFMGKGWDRSGIAYKVEVWRECLRVLKAGGHLLAFGGSRTYHRLACAVEDAGFEIRDQIQWLYGSGFPKSLDISKAIDAASGAEREVIGPRIYADGTTGHFGTSHEGYSRPSTDRKIANREMKTDSAPASDAAKQWNGWGTALKPAHEPIVLARKPLIGTVVENVLEHGTGGLNIDGSRVDGAKGNGNWSGACEQRPEDIFEGGWNEQRTIQNDLGRWPANVIHDGSDEVLAGFPSVHGAGSQRNGGEADQGGRGGIFGVGNHNGNGMRFGDEGSAARFFYCAKASKEDREEGLDDLPIRSAGEVTDRQDGSDGLNSPRAGAGRTNGSRNHHPTVKPTDLMRYLCRLVTPPNGLVLDPFCGSGSTGKAAMLEGLRFIGIEKESEYVELARRRIEVATRQGRLNF